LHITTNPEVILAHVLILVNKYFQIDRRHPQEALGRHVMVLNGYIAQGVASQRNLSRCDHSGRGWPHSRARHPGSRQDAVIQRNEWFRIRNDG